MPAMVNPGIGGACAVEDMHRFRTGLQLARQALLAARRCLNEVPSTYRGRAHLSNSLVDLEALVVRVEELSARMRTMVPSRSARASVLEAA